MSVAVIASFAFSDCVLTKRDLAGVLLATVKAQEAPYRIPHAVRADLATVEKDRLRGGRWADRVQYVSASSGCPSKNLPPRCLRSFPFRLTAGPSMGQRVLALRPRRRSLRKVPELP